MPDFARLRRPTWWPAWTDYPHGSLTEKQARELSGYCVRLEELVIAMEKREEPPDA